MRRLKFFIPLLALFALAAQLPLACEPTVTVTNKTDAPIRVVITAPGGMYSAVAPSPGESSSIVLTEPGAYEAALIDDKEWLDYAQAKRKAFNELLTTPASLTGPRLLEVVKNLNEIGDQMAKYQRAIGSTASCRGNIETSGVLPFEFAVLLQQPSGGSVAVSRDSSGKYQISCQ